VDVLTLDPTYSQGNLTITTGSAGVTIDQAYLDQAGEWGRQAGEEWARDVERLEQEWIGEVENGFAAQRLLMSTGTAATTLTINATTNGTTGWVDLGTLDTWTPAPLTEEQALARREEEYRRDNASWRAHELLLRHLTPNQREDYEWDKRFTVKTKRGHRYVIGQARCQNVLRVNKRGKPMRVYCVTVHGGVPMGDVLLAQKLMLESDEDHFLKVARQWPVRFGCGLGDLISRKKKMPVISIGDSGVVWTPSTQPLEPVIINGEQLAA
jgi:hypothetical protein